MKMNTSLVRWVASGIWGVGALLADGSMAFGGTPQMLSPNDITADAPFVGILFIKKYKNTGNPK